MMSYKKLLSPYVLLIAGIIFGIFLRFQDLGYSNFQGDEILALLPASNNSHGLVQQLLSQRKGPIQFLFNVVYSYLTHSKNEAVLRFPYAVFGSLGIGLAYVVGSKLFSKKTGIVVAVLFALNGLFISFSRIVQYQSLMFLLQFATVLVVLQAFRTMRYRWYALASFLSGFLVLIHYDGGALLVFSASLFLYYVLNSHKEKKSIRPILQRGLLFLIVLAVCIGIFYVPFYMTSSFQSNTGDYLTARLLGGGFMPRTAQSIQLLSLYVPTEFWFGFFVLSLIGIWNAHRTTLANKKIGMIYLASIVLLFFATWFSQYPIKPRFSSLLVFMSSLSISTIALFFSQSSARRIALTHWYLFAFFFYFFFVRDPRTHVYIAMIPGMFFIGHALQSAMEWCEQQKRFFRILPLAILLGIVVYWVGYDWVIYKDKTPEHPWWSKQYFNRTLSKIVESKRIDGVFGFNSYRGWEQISDLYQRGCLKGTFESNEKDVVTKYYLGFPQVAGDKWTLDGRADTLAVVEGPHSWIYESHREFLGYIYLTTLYTPYGLPVTYLFGKPSVYPNGALLCSN